MELLELTIRKSALPVFLEESRRGRGLAPPSSPGTG
jgi:hypothetical protein